ncbi:MAG: hypothetical protein ABEH38_06565 [Flavobacteriales bacterium]
MSPLVDINLTNHGPHPTRPGYHVFRFKDHDQGNYFEGLLEEEGLEYEKTVTDDEKRLMLFAIKRRQLQKAQRLNDRVSARFRSRFIPQKGLRIFVISIFALLLLLAIMGFFFSE